MSFVRPEAQAAILRWRETAIGGVVLLVGLYWASGGGILKWVGICVAIGGGLLVYTGLQRARFLSGKGGPGIVTVDEGEISYYGPISGGVTSIGELSLLMLDPSQSPAVWILQQNGRPDIAIPVNAEGADALFDAFSVLPGIRTEHMLNSLNSSPDHPVVIWAKSVARLH